MKSQLEDYQLKENNILIFCDNISAMCLSKNPILHFRAKHIKIKHYFVRDHVHKAIINLKFRLNYNFGPSSFISFDFWSPHFKIRDFSPFNFSSSEL